MADASVKLANGTNITVSGTAEEIAKIMSLYNQEQVSPAPRSVNKRKTSKSKPSTTPQQSSSENNAIDLASIVNTIKDCDEAETIEVKILDNADVMNRTLMCLYVNNKYFDSSPAMTTGDISKTLTQLGVPVATANVSSAIARKAKSYVMSDAVRTKGAVIRYKLNRRGIQYFEKLLGNEIGPTHNSSSSANVKRTRSPAKSKPHHPEKTTSTKPKRAGGYKPKYNADLDLLGLKPFIQKLTLKNNSEYLIAFYQFLANEAKLAVINGDDIFTCFAEMKAEVKMPGSFMNTLQNAQNRDHIIFYEGGFTNLEMKAKGENMYHHDIVKR